MKARFHFAIIIFIAISFCHGSLSAFELNEPKLSEQLQEIKHDIASSAKDGELNILFEKTYQANALHYKKKIKIEQGKSYELFAVMDKSEGKMTTVLYNTNGEPSEYEGELFDDDGLKYSGHSIEQAKQSKELTLQVVTDKLSKGTPIYLGIVEYLLPTPAVEQKPNKPALSDRYYEQTLNRVGYVKAYSAKGFLIKEASELPIILEMDVHEGNDYQVIATFSNNRAIPRVVIADPARGNKRSKDDDFLASLEIRTVHKGVKQYYVKIEKVSGDLKPDDKVYIYQSYRTSTNDSPYESVANAALNKSEDYFSKKD